MENLSKKRILTVQEKIRIQTFILKNGQRLTNEQMAKALNITLPQQANIIRVLKNRQLIDDNWLKTDICNKRKITLQAPVAPVSVRTVRIDKEMLTKECLQCLALYTKKDHRFYSSNEIVIMRNSVKRLRSVGVNKLQSNTYKNIEFLNKLAEENDYIIVA